MGRPSPSSPVDTEQSLPISHRSSTGNRRQRTRSGPVLAGAITALVTLVAGCSPSTEQLADQASSAACDVLIPILDGTHSTVDSIVETITSNPDAAATQLETARTTVENLQAELPRFAARRLDDIVTIIDDLHDLATRAGEGLTVDDAQLAEVNESVNEAFATAAGPCS